MLHFITINVYNAALDEWQDYTVFGKDRDTCRDKADRLAHNMAIGNAAENWEIVDEGDTK